MNPPSLLDAILEPGALSVVFQPIVDLAHGTRIHSLEGLVRGPRDTVVASPAVLFEYARRKREEARVDRACVEAILGAARQIHELRIAINVHASTLSRDLAFPEMLAKSAATNRIAIGRLAVEIVEHAPPFDGPTFRTALEALRSLGVRITLDDIGLGHSNYKMIVDCRPDYFKIDRYFVDGSHADKYKRAALESVADLARKLGGKVVAEGVEEEADLAAIRGAGIDLVQGFLFLEPRPTEDYAALTPPAEGAGIGRLRSWQERNAAWSAIRGRLVEARVPEGP